MLIFQNFKTTTLQPKQPQLYSTHRSLAQDGDVRGFKHSLGKIIATVSKLFGTICTFVFPTILIKYLLFVHFMLNLTYSILFLNGKVGVDGGYRKPKTAFNGGSER